MDPGRSETEVTKLLDALARGEKHVAGELLPLIYDELRRQAARLLDRLPPGQTLGPTALVHEAYLRLVGAESARRWDHSGHFYVAAAEAMRHILLDRARDKAWLKRGGGRLRKDFTMALDTVIDDSIAPDDLLDLDEALCRLAVVDPTAAGLVQLRLFAGLNLGEAAEALGLARRTADRDWAFARAWLLNALRDPG